MATKKTKKKTTRRRVTQRIEDWTTPERLALINGWARDGLTNEQIAENMGVVRDTLYRWAKKSSDISDALKTGKDIADRQVENALFKSATGFYYEEDAVTQYGDVVRVQKYQKPSTTSQIFWLKNRKPEHWRDKRELSHDGEISNHINLQNITDDDLRELAKLDKLGKEV